MHIGHFNAIGFGPKINGTLTADETFGLSVNAAQTINKEMKRREVYIDNNYFILTWKSRNTNILHKPEAIMKFQTDMFFCRKGML